MYRKKNSNTKVINNTDKPLELFDAIGTKYCEVPPNGGRLSTFTNAQVAQQKACASRVEIVGNFVKSMEREQELIELLKDHLGTYYALNIMKHFLVKDYNVLVKADGKKYTAVDLGNALSVSRQSANEHIKRLKELNVVKSIKTKKYGTVFAINPYYYMNGNNVPKEIDALFNSVKGV